MGGVFLLKASEFKNKEVINLNGSEKLGYIYDFEICISTGEISAIYVPEKQNSFFKMKSSPIRIPWKKIEGIGDDVILVNVENNNIDA
jgi:YlmC/YmxH family sporulation protein